MTALIIVLGLGLASVVFAYVPLALIIRHTLNTWPLRVQPPEPDEYHQYVVEDSISTEEYLRWVDEKWREIKHAPLR